MFLSPIKVNVEQLHLGLFIETVPQSDLYEIVLPVAEEGVECPGHLVLAGLLKAFGQDGLTVGETSGISIFPEGSDCSRPSTQ